ncbi:hypothetical protein Bpfe_003801, partial [Biomphalaria pfeifferi]
TRVGLSMCDTGYTSLWTSSGLTVGGGLVNEIERKERLCQGHVSSCQLRAAELMTRQIFQYRFDTAITDISYCQL